MMPRQESQTSSSSTVEDRREPASVSCAPETRRLLRWGSLGVSLLLVVSAFTWWWASRLISAPVASTSRGETPASNGSARLDFEHLHRMNIQEPLVLLPRRRKSKSRKADAGCPVDEEYGSVCDYLECSAREEAAKSILLWNVRWTFAPEWTNERGVSGLIGCAPRDCLVTAAPSTVPAEAYDALVFSMGESDSPHVMEAPVARSCSQRYVFLVVQYPRRVTSWEHWRFNWTMTYRLDSDVPLPVGRVVAKPGVRDPERGWMRPTREPVANDMIDFRPPDEQVLTWLTTCKMEKGDAQYNAINYMKSMSEFVKIRIFRLSVDFWSKEMWLNFYEYIYKIKYKFYLVFEFPQCNHFAASHVFRVLQVNTIPVVFGGANYSSILPPHSYIDGAKFKSPVRLAIYLQYLLHHPHEYAQYFWWKQYYEVQINTQRNLCRLCARLHADHEPKSYQDVRKWMDRDVF